MKLLLIQNELNIINFVIGHNMGFQIMGINWCKIVWAAWLLPMSPRHHSASSLH